MAKKVELPTHLIYESRAFLRLQESGILGSLSERRLVVVSGMGPTRKISEQLIAGTKLQPAQIKALYCTENTIRIIDELEIRANMEFAEMIIGVGGGRILDVSKAVGKRMNIPVMLVPTSLSCDAICSPVASIRVNPAKSVSIKVDMPWAVVIDSDIIAGAPGRLIRSGIGDLLSNKTALEDWKLANKAKNETISGAACMMANHAVEAFLNTVNRNKSDRAALLHITAESLIMSGMAMAVAGTSRPCSGSEHLISHALDNYCGGKAFHGEQVAIGLLISEYLQGKYNAEDNMRQYFNRLGLPTHYRQLGYTKDEMVLAVQKSPAIRNRYTILNETELTSRHIGHVLETVFPS
ncbi:iron-containing alcohol dehydrogenase family protein [Paenibacillus sp. sptzw28]|uniref:iron-containing alcohol dehydrogenase family protein n=1 Tax=Paenibacillus sp. sptzw28 TaxID=715179 RepID=UPI001C6E2AA8|nr:iron-containing alcohol dehydrogenase family protein [Paenibacillus sp. sptzw28]QYR22811.1 iron-containing alcohol dehydrogenase family protein [Paenibacillus sp. sptzw28]